MKNNIPVNRTDLWKLCVIRTVTLQLQWAIFGNELPFSGVQFIEVNCVEDIAKWLEIIEIGWETSDTGRVAKQSLSGLRLNWKEISDRNLTDENIFHLYFCSTNTRNMLAAVLLITEVSLEN